MGTCSLHRSHCPESLLLSRDGSPWKDKAQAEPWPCLALWPALLRRLTRGARPPRSAAVGRAACQLLSGLASGPLVLAAVQPRSRSPWAEAEPRPHPPPRGPLPRRLPGPHSSFAHQEPGPGHHARDDGTTCSAPPWSPCWPWGVSDEGPSGWGDSVGPSLVPRALQGQNWWLVSLGVLRTEGVSPPGPC